MLLAKWRRRGGVVVKQNGGGGGGGEVSCFFNAQSTWFVISGKERD